MDTLMDQIYSSNYEKKTIITYFRDKFKKTIPECGAVAQGTFSTIFY